MADTYTATTIDELDIDTPTEGGTRLRDLNDAIREIKKVLKETIGVSFDLETGKAKEPHFFKVVTLEENTASTAVNIIPDEDVGESQRVYVTYWHVEVLNANWAGKTKPVYIEGTDQVSFFELQGNALNTGLFSGFTKSTGTGQLQHRDPWAQGVGGTKGKGLQIRGSDNGNNAGSLVLVIAGYILDSLT